MFHQKQATDSPIAASAQRDRASAHQHPRPQDHRAANTFRNDPD